MTLQRKSLVDQVESALMSEIEQGRWEGLLPGLRELAKIFEVSVPTLSAAIDRLTKRGVLLGRGGRRRFQVAKRAGARHAQGKARKRLLIITSQGGITIQSKAATDVLHAFSVALNRRGWAVQYAEIDFYDAQKPHRNWDELLKGERIDRILVLFGRESIGQWALNTGLPTCFLGGYAGDLPIPIIGVRSFSLLEHALERLITAGHRGFFVPLCRRHPTFVDSLRKSYAKVLAAHDLAPKADLEVPAADTHTPETILRLMERAWAQPKPPTGIIFMDWRDCVAGLGFLLARGLRIPEDVSVITLSHEHQSEWFRPTLAHYSLPEEGFVKALLRWIDDKPHNPDVLLRKMLESFETGKSIATPKA